MSGEYAVARKTVAQALGLASEDRSMSPEAMADALLATLLTQLIKVRTRKDLMSFIEYQIEAAGEDEFVITRGS